jgi:hypothetical protein
VGLHTPPNRNYPLYTRGLSRVQDTLFTEHTAQVGDIQAVGQLPTYYQHVKTLQLLVTRLQVDSTSQVRGPVHALL